MNFVFESFLCQAVNIVFKHWAIWAARLRLRLRGWGSLVRIRLSSRKWLRWQPISKTIQAPSDDAFLILTTPTSRIRQSYFRLLASLQCISLNFPRALQTLRGYRTVHALFISRLRWTIYKMAHPDPGASSISVTGMRNGSIGG